MEYLKVVVAGTEEGLPVIINEEVLGSTGEILIVAEGNMKVAVDAPGAIPQIVCIEDTTPNNPLEVFIECEE